METLKGDFETNLRALLERAQAGETVDASGVLDHHTSLQNGFNQLFCMCQQLQTTTQFLQQKSNAYKNALVEIVHAYLTNDPQILRDVLEQYANPTPNEKPAATAATGATIH